MKLNKHLVIEKEGEYRNIPYYVCFNMITGYRLGYAVFESNLELGEGIYEIDVHGGVTFDEITDNHPVNFSKEKRVIGFDCGHYGDAQDTSVWSEYLFSFTDESYIRTNYELILKTIEFYKKDYHTEKKFIASKEYVEENIKKMIDQILSLQKT